MGKKTKVLARISTVAGEKGSADTVRDIRGWALKFFTDEGNYDIVGNDLPVFFIRDPIKFPSLNRSHKRHPQTGVADSSMFWDFHNNNQEGVHCLMQLFGKRGVPASLRNIVGYGVHTFKFGRTDNGKFKYVKIHFKPDAGVENLDDAEATRLAGEQPDYHIKDIYNAIEQGDYPTWTMYLQIMDPEDAEKYRWNIFDATKIWPHKDYPLQPVGKLTLNQNPKNHFQEVEQAAFSPSTLVPGIDATADIMLQARMFSYPDAARYRVGPNYQQLPCNKAKYVYSPYQRDGPMRIDGNYGGDPDYGMCPRNTAENSICLMILLVRSTFRPVQENPPDSLAHIEWVNSKVEVYTSPVEEDDFEQARDLWDIFLKQGADQSFIDDLCAHLNKALPQVQKETVKMFAKVKPEIGERIEKKLKDMGETKSKEHVKATYGIMRPKGDVW